MKLNRIFLSATVVGLALLLSSPSQAALITFDFANPATVPTSFTPCNGAATPDRCGTTLEFTDGGSELTVTASAIDFLEGDDRHVIQDLNNGTTLDPAGLGVVDAFSRGSQSGNDNVSVGDILKLDFGSIAVALKNVGFNDDHDIVFQAGEQFLFSTNGIAYSAMNLAPSINFNVSGTSFYFKHAGGSNKFNDFYVSSITVQQEEEAPEPGTLLLLGAGLLGLVGARRRTR